MLGNSWFQLDHEAVLGVVVTQFSFVGHDAAHRQMFGTPAWNESTSSTLAGPFAGLNYGWRKDKHNRPHVAPNSEDPAPDVGPGLIAFTRDIAARRTTGLAGWFMRRQ